MNSVTVSDLEYGCMGLPLHLRILRKWIPYYRSNETWFIGVDTNGEGIALLGEDADKAFLESSLQLHSCYAFANYTCLYTTESQRVLRNPLHLSVGCVSKITKQEDDGSIPNEWFDFCNMGVFESLIDEPLFFPDRIQLASTYATHVLC